MLDELGKNELCQEEIDMIDQARQILINAFKKLGENPSNFDANITCLERFALAFHTWLAMVKFHIERQRPAPEESKKSFLSFLSFFSNEEISSVLQFSKFTQGILHRGLDANLKEYLRGETRILGFNYKFNFNVKEVLMRQDQSKTAKELYTIIFSDNSTITLPNLKPESIEQARDEFTKKMNELPEPNQYVYS